jgi:hypothetical protein
MNCKNSWKRKITFRVVGLCDNDNKTLSAFDGNKRTALSSALAFLEMNGNTVDDPTGMLFDAMISLATGKLGKSEFAQILRVLKSERGA